MPNILSNNPLKMEQYNLTDSTTTNRSAGFTIQQLVSNQLNRIDYLRTIPMSDNTISPLKVISSIKYGLRSIESKLYPFIYENQEYKDNTKPLKEKLQKINNVEESMELLAQWEDIIVSKLGVIDLLPQQSKEFEFD